MLFDLARGRLFVIRVFVTRIIRYTNTRIWNCGSLHLTLVFMVTIKLGNDEQALVNRQYGRRLTRVTLVTNYASNVDHMRV